MVVAGTVIATVAWGVVSTAAEIEWEREKREKEREKCMSSHGWQHDELSQKASQTCSVFISSST